MNRKNFLKSSVYAIGAALTSIPFFGSKSKASDKKVDKKVVTIDDDVDEIVINSSRGTIAIYEKVNGEMGMHTYMTSDGDKDIKISYTKNIIEGEVEWPIVQLNELDDIVTRGIWGTKGPIGDIGIRGDIGNTGWDGS